MKAILPPAWPEYDVPLDPSMEWTPINTDAPIAYVRPRTDGHPGWEVIECPFCLGTHVHSAGAGDPRRYLGGRESHCLGGEYRLVEVKHQPPRQRRASLRRSIDRATKAKVWAKTDGNCWYCGTPTNPFRNFEVDHYIPVSRGGTGELGNLVPCCSRCNAKKGNRGAETLRRGQHPFYGEMHQDDADEGER